MADGLEHYVEGRTPLDAVQHISTDNNYFAFVIVDSDIRDPKLMPVVRAYYCTLDCCLQAVDARFVRYDPRNGDNSWGRFVYLLATKTIPELYDVSKFTGELIDACPRGPVGDQVFALVDDGLAIEVLGVCDNENKRVLRLYREYLYATRETLGSYLAAARSVMPTTEF